MEKQQDKRTFTLANGKEVYISLTIGTLLSVKEEKGYDLVQIEKGTNRDEEDVNDNEREQGFVEKLLFDDYMIPEILSVVCRKSYKEQGMTKEEFLENFDGTALSEANQVFFDEFIRFFKESGRKDRATLVQGAWELRQKAREKLNESVDFESLKKSALEEAEKELEKVNFSGKASGESPESLE